MATSSCQVCGRSVEGLAEAREQEGRWFCSESHYLDWESRSRRRLRRRHNLSGLLVVLAVVGFASVLALNQTSGESTLDRYQRQTPQEVRGEIRACFTRHRFHVYSPSVIDPYGEHYDSDGVVFLTKVHTPSGSNLSWRVYRTNIDGKTITTIEWGVSGVTDSQLNKNPCYPS